MTDTNCYATLTSDDAASRSDAELVARIRCRLERLTQLGCNSRDSMFLAARLDLDVARDPDPRLRATMRRALPRQAT